MDTMDAAFVFHRVRKVYWYSSSGLDDFRAYDFATSTIRGYPFKRPTLMKSQKVDICPNTPVLVPAVDSNSLLGVARKMISDVNCDNRRYSAVIYNGCNLPADLQSNVVDEPDGVFT